MSKIIWFQQNALPLELSRLTQEILSDFDHTQYQAVLRTCLALGFWPRSSRPTTPFVNDPDFFNAAIPAFDSNFGLDFSTITDDRCNWLRTHKWDRPWLVEWSGGLDSTVIISSIIRNLSSHDFDNITVGLTRSSVYENPVFFEQCIRKNFSIMDISGDAYGDIYRTHYLVNGEPADMLPGGGLAEHAQRCGIDLKLSWRDSRDLLIDFLSTTVARRSGAIWLYDKIHAELLDPAEGLPPVDSIVEWFWWINFCWKWMPLTMHRFYPGDQDARAYMDSLINWFDSIDYQQWSMVEGRYSLVKQTKQDRYYKTAWRDYIYTVWPDDYYNQFKIKTTSSSIKPNHITAWACLLDDFTYLRLDRDLTRIKELWPTVINSTS